MDSIFSSNGIQPICKGYGVRSPDWRSSIITHILLFIPSVIFIVFTLRYFVKEYQNYPSLIIGIFLFLFSYLTLIRTSLTDPGILPARRNMPKTVKRYFRTLSDVKIVEDIEQIDRIKKHTLKSGKIVHSRWCYTCNIWRTPRASHCSVCEVCIDEFDHHCPWVGTCVGKRNYRYFFLFLTSTLLLCLYALGFSIAHVVIESKKKDSQGKSAGFYEGIRKSPASCFIIIYSIITILAITGLWGYHFSLVVKGMTTSEDIKKKRNGDKIGFLKRMYLICFGVIMPSSIDPNFCPKPIDDDSLENHYEYLNPYYNSYLNEPLP